MSAVQKISNHCRMRAKKIVRMQSERQFQRHDGHLLLDDPIAVRFEHPAAPFSA